MPTRECAIHQAKLLRLRNIPCIVSRVKPESVLEADPRMTGDLRPPDQVDPPVRCRKDWRVTLGGTEHTGWLPGGAVLPRPEPLREVVLKVQIEVETGGFLLTY